MPILSPLLKQWADHGSKIGTIRLVQLFQIQNAWYLIRQRKLILLVFRPICSILISRKNIKWNISLILRENSLIYNKAELKYVRSKRHSIHGHAHEQIINRTALGSRTSRNPQWLLLRVPKSSHHSHRYLRERKKRTHFTSCYRIYASTQIL